MTDRHDGAEGLASPHGPTAPHDGRRGASTPPRLSRRGFLRGSGMVAATAGAGLLATGCEPSPPAAPTHDHGPSILPSDAVPDGAARDALQFLNADQARALDAMVARIIPGDDGDPGAREAGAVFYIDHLLATHTGYAETTYTKGPHAEAFPGDEPPADEDGVVWVHEDELERYGWQSAYVPRELYEMGLPRVDELARRRYGGDFADADDGQQDELLAALEDDEDDDVGEVFDAVAAAQFFELVRTHTVQGFLCDPVYGGNRDMVGWRLVGFPGAQRAWAPEEMQTEGFAREPQSLLDLPAFHSHREEHADEALITVRRRHPRGPID